MVLCCYKHGITGCDGWIQVTKSILLGLYRPCHQPAVGHACEETETLVNSGPVCCILLPQPSTLVNTKSLTIKTSAKCFRPSVFKLWNVEILSHLVNFLLMSNPLSHLSMLWLISRACIWWLLIYRIAFEYSRTFTNSTTFPPSNCSMHN